MKKVLSFSLIGILIFQPLFILAEEDFIVPKQLIEQDTDNENKLTETTAASKDIVETTNNSKSNTFSGEILNYENQNTLSREVINSWQELLLTGETGEQGHSWTTKLDKIPLPLLSLHKETKREKGIENNLPTLIITEAFFHTKNSRIEITNMGTHNYNWEISLSGISKNEEIFQYTVDIPAQTSLVLAKNKSYFTGEILKKIIKDKYFINWKNWLDLTLTYWSGQEDHLIVHPERTNYLKRKDTSFEKVLLNGEWLTTRTTLDRIRNIKSYVEDGETYQLIANPGLYFTEAENAKDISQPKTPEEPGSHPEVPITCSAFTDRYRLEIQEIFQGNSVYQPFVELKWTDTPAEYQAIRLTGTILEKETIINKSELREKNKTFVIGKNEFWHDKGIDSDFHSDFTLLNQTWYLIIEGFNGQTRQVLDTALLTTIASGKSSYFWGEKSDCVPLFNEVWELSPGFDQKFLEFFQIDSEPK